MASDPRYKLARLAEAHGILQRDHANALESKNSAEAAHRRLGSAVEARAMRLEELEDALTTLSAQARAVSWTLPEKDVFGSGTRVRGPDPKPGFSAGNEACGTSPSLVARAQVWWHGPQVWWRPGSCPPAPRWALGP